MLRLLIICSRQKILTPEGGLQSLSGMSTDHTLDHNAMNRNPVRPSVELTTNAPNTNVIQKRPTQGSYDRFTTVHSIMIRGGRGKVEY